MTTFSPWSKHRGEVRANLISIPASAPSHWPKAEDGDPLDVLILHDAQTYPGVVLRCRPIGILEVEQKSKGKTERNDRVFAVPDRSPLEADLKDIRELPSHARDDLEQFFRATNALEKKELKFLG
jgi:inorganic pyrophosphatase